MVKTERLILRHFEEADRNALVELLMNEEFMVFSSSGAFDYESASCRFNQIIDFHSSGRGKKKKRDGDFYFFSQCNVFCLQLLNF
jgi:RimJ/RimL family protein N-acetyltransferase